MQLGLGQDDEDDGGGVGVGGGDCHSDDCVMMVMWRKPHSFTIESGTMDLGHWSAVGCIV